MSFGFEKSYYYLNADLREGRWIFTRQQAECVLHDPDIEFGRVIQFSDSAECGEYGVFVEMDSKHEGLAFLKACSAIHRYIKEKSPVAWRKDFGQL